MPCHPLLRGSTFTDNPSPNLVAHLGELRGSVAHPLEARERLFKLQTFHSRDGRRKSRGNGGREDVAVGQLFHAIFSRLHVLHDPPSENGGGLVTYKFKDTMR